MNSRQRSSIYFTALTAVVLMASLFFSSELKKVTTLISFAKSISDVYVDSTLPKKSTAVVNESSLSSLVLENKVATSSAESSANSSVLVMKVTDGDTITLESGEKLRYIGINTPELHSPFTGKECFGEEAHQANRDLVLGKRIKIEKDKSETDKYDRLLRYVWVDDVFVNEKLVAEGFAYAKDYPPDSKYKAVFAAAEAKAREQKLGMWAKCPVH